VDPVEVGVQDLHHPVDASLEVGTIQKRQLVQLGQRRRDALGRCLPGEDRNQALGRFGRVVELGPADLGNNRVRADHEGDRVRFGDAGADLLPSAR
jgi:hypothetical protein